MARSPARLVPVVLAVAGLLAAACAGASPPGAIPSATAGPGDPAPAAEVAPTEPKYAATQVLVAWAGAASAPASVTRTEAEAQARAVEVWRRATAGEPLEDLAPTMSDATSAPRGGGIGVYRTGTLVPAFERAVAALAIGEVSRPFATPYGWHVVRRDAIREIEARHVLVTWKGAWRSGATRTRDEARARLIHIKRGGRREEPSWDSRPVPVQCRHSAR